jgi:hypothetical protein
MTWLFIAASLAAALAATWCLRRPVRHRNVRLADFDRYFEAWVPKLANGALIFIREEASKHFVQFAVYRSDGDAIVQFALPEADWSAGFFGDVSSALKRAGFDVRIESTDVETIPRFLVCDLQIARESLARDVAEVARTALAAMGHQASDRFTIWCEGTFNHQAPLDSLEKLQKHPSANVRRWAEGRLARLGRE